MCGVRFSRNEATPASIRKHLGDCSDTFVPPLAERVNLDDYAEKLAKLSIRVEAWVGGDLAGLVAFYCNDLQSRTAFVTSVSVSKEFRGRGIALALLKLCIAECERVGMATIELSVATDNVAARHLYAKCGFVAAVIGYSPLNMSLRLEEVTGV